MCMEADTCTCVSAYTHVHVCMHTAECDLALRLQDLAFWRMDWFSAPPQQNQTFLAPASRAPQVICALNIYRIIYIYICINIYIYYVGYIHYIYRIYRMTYI